MWRLENARPGATARLAKLRDPINYCISFKVNVFLLAGLIFKVLTSIPWSVNFVTDNTVLACFIGKLINLLSIKRLDRL